MEKYLKMVDCFVMPVSNYGGGDCICESDGFEFAKMACGASTDFAIHAINSHDELVAMNKELLAALELMLLIHDEPSGFCGKFGKELDMAIEDQKEKIDTRIAVARNAIAKAKDAS